MQCNRPCFIATEAALSKNWVIGGPAKTKDIGILDFSVTFTVCSCHYGV